MSTWDRLGIWISGLCAIHCLLMPVVIATLPLWSSTLHLHAWTHLVFAALLIPVTVFAVRGAYQAHRPQSILVLLVSGLVLVVGAALFHETLGEVGEALVTLVGSVLLIVGHWRNWRTRTHTHA